MIPIMTIILIIIILVIIKKIYIIIIIIIININIIITTIILIILIQTFVIPLTSVGPNKKRRRANRLQDRKVTSSSDSVGVTEEIRDGTNKEAIISGAGWRNKDFRRIWAWLSKDFPVCSVEQNSLGSLCLALHN